ncbi:MAG: VanW family protein [Myxococcota bacterium]
MLRTITLVALVGLFAALPTRAHLQAAPEVATPSVPRTLPRGFALDTTMARYETRYRTYGRHRGRAHNVERAAALIDNTIVPPGGTFSFNGTVGPRTRRNGFRLAPVIEGGELVRGLGGGGVCQVASTLHAAALKAGLRVDARPHSRPSSYISLGLDAAVSYPALDLVITNPHDFPVQFRVHAEEGEVRAELVGDERFDVEVGRRVLGRRGFGQRVVEDASLAPGEQVVAQEGIRGARVEVTRTFASGAVERRVVQYPPTERIIRIGVRGGAEGAHPPEEGSPVAARTEARGSALDRTPSPRSPAGA